MPISFVRNLGNVQSKSAGTTLALGMPTGSSPAGNRLVVMFSMDPATGPVTCADGPGNSYVLASDVTNGSGTSGVREVTFTAHITNGLAGSIAGIGGSTITVTHPSAAARSMSVLEFSGATVANDASALGGSAATGTGTGAASLTKSDHAAGSERLFLGGIGREAASNTVTQPAGWTDVPAIGTSGGAAATNVHTSGGWRIESSAPASVTYDPTHTASANWAGSLVAIRGTASDPAAVHSVAASGASASTGTAGALLDHRATSSGLASSTGTSAALLDLQATADGTATTTGAAAAAIVAPALSVHDVAAVGQSTTAGDAAGRLALVATADGTSTTTGTASPTIEAPAVAGVLDATASGLSATTGDALALREAHATAIGLSVSSGTAVAALTLAAAAIGLSRTSGDVFSTRPIPVGAVVRLARPRASVGLVRSIARTTQTEPNATTTVAAPSARVSGGDS